MCFSYSLNASNCVNILCSHTTEIAVKQLKLFNIIPSMTGI
uniref:Uncharacterized protein n=1 Tax=Anguilla anguilla TaxID=7936 RepID=A0A0E9TB66_ANGAN